MFKSSVTKLLLFFQISVMSVLMIGAVYLTITSIRNFRSARLAVDLVTVDKALFLGATGSRGVLTPTQGALQSSEAPKQLIADLRRKAEEKLEGALSALKSAPLDGRDDLITAIQSARTEVEKTQSIVDSQADKPLAERDVAVGLAPWRTAVFKLADKLSDAGDLAGNAVRLTDPSLAELVQVRQLAWRIRDAYGSQCALLRPTITKNLPMDQMVSATWNKGRGNYEAAWADLEVLMKREGFSPPLAQAAQAAHKAISTGQAAVDRMAASVGVAGKEAPSPATFSAECTAPNDVIVDIAFRALDLASDRANDLKYAAIVEILTIMVVSSLALFGIVYSLLALRRRFSQPIAGLMLAVGRLTRREFNERIGQTGYADEIGAMAQALESLRESALTAEGLERQAAEARDKELTRSRNIESACHAFESGSFTALSNLERSAGDLTATSTHMRDLAGDSSERSAAAARNAREVTTNVQTVAAATEELSASINDISARASAGAQNAEQAVRQAEDTRRTVDALNSAAVKIGEVIALINGIAAQTNLLALNATIEAARAGDAGKGFAVVAGEVKSLANQTARATEDIGRQIEEIQTATANAVSAIGSMGQTIGHINDAVAAIADAAEQQLQATQEISASIQKAAHNTRLATDDVAQVAQSNQRTGEAAGEVMQSLEEQQRQQNLLKTAVETFIGQVKTI
ncbi:methyl-accepting chemotaxis protein [Telmatospirillum siberiense]|uniref:Methyl-accepting chemotaxis protein n=1 Tax=Telmatospirillum siberiense TaxID=382514 RepID=A0A2N3PMK3_9PROT|nr:HAMP domain-containing methyl-accepting chemotaxis protein [Telmatospirillum siberiense]PKU21624.1 hypothetical protein CWS72_25795 [Telmatospirillum siberiense]